MRIDGREAERLSQYEALAASYDRLTRDIAYETMLDFMEALLHQQGRQAETVLDLACGTGAMSLLLAKRGYRVIGADISEQMLTEAYEKAMELEDNRPYFICQPMQHLALPEQVDWVVCCLDSLNYITSPADCRGVFRRVFACLKPGGTFVFDVNTPEKLRGLDGQIFLDEDEDTYCVWRAEFSQEENSIFYGMDLFQKQGRLWRRSFEEHQEYAYALQDLALWLEEAGFHGVCQFGDCRQEPPRPQEQRVYFLALKE